MHFCNTIWSLQIYINAFGLKSASKVFQKKDESVFEEIRGIHIVADNIIVAEATVQEHDQIFRQVLERAKETKGCFSFDMFQLRVPKVKYLGTVD